MVLSAGYHVAVTMLSDSLRHPCLRAINTYTCIQTELNCLQIWALCSKSAESVMCNWVVWCVSFLQEWCCTRRYILTTQLGAWYKGRHWVGWYLLDCKLESCTQCLNMTAVTHRLALCWLSNHHYIKLCCLEVHEVEKLHADWVSWEGYMYGGTCQDSHLWASLIVWPF